MKTTIELPDELFREAKATAARRGTSLKSLVTDALEEKLARDSALPRLSAPSATWPIPAPNVSKAEMRRVRAIIEAETERIDDGGWPVAPRPLSPQAQREFDRRMEEFERIEPDEHALDN